MDSQYVRSCIWQGFLLGLVLTPLLIVFVFASGQTFGQRCAKEYEPKSRAWSQCISKLSKGESV